MIGKTDSSSIIRTEINDNHEEAYALELQATHELLNQGANLP